MPPLQQNPQVDPTVMKPEEWQQYLHNAIAALHANPRDQEAYQAVADANLALSAYDQAEAASPSERISAGVSGGLAGLSRAPGDIIHGISQTIAHPIQAVENIPAMYRGLKTAVTSDNPEEIGRAVGDIGGLLLPGAKLSGKVGYAAGLEGRLPFGIGPMARAASDPAIVGAPTLGSVPWRIGKAIVRSGKAWLERPSLTNEGIRLQNALKQAEILAPKRETNPLVEEKTRLQVEKLKRELSQGPDPLSAEGKKLANDLKRARLANQPMATDALDLGNKLKKQKLGSDQRAPGTGAATLENIDLRNQALKAKLGQSNPSSGTGDTGLDVTTSPAPATAGPKAPITPSPKVTGAENVYPTSSKGGKYIVPKSSIPQAGGQFFEEDFYKNGAPEEADVRAFKKAHPLDQPAQNLGERLATGAKSAVGKVKKWAKKRAATERGEFPTDEEGPVVEITPKRGK